VIALLKSQSKKLKSQSASMIDGDSVWYELAQTSRSIEGVGGCASAHIVAHLPEIDLIDNKTAPRHICLAPLAEGW
jgi:uncharacterized protein (UPF0218 family)